MHGVFGAVDCHTMQKCSTQQQPHDKVMYLMVLIKDESLLTMKWFCDAVG